MRLSLAIIAVVLFFACRTPAPDAPWEDLDVPAGLQPITHQTNFHLTWRGQRIGHATETLKDRSGGLLFHRVEHVKILRSGVPVAFDTDLHIHLASDWTAREVVLSARAGGTLLRGRAQRTDNDDWYVELSGEPDKIVSGTAIPIELIPWLAKRNPNRLGKHADVMIAGFGFAIARLRIASNTKDGLVTELRTPYGKLTSTLHWSTNGTVGRISDDDGGGAQEVDDSQAQVSFDPPEIVTPATIPIAGDAQRARRFELHPVQRPAPPSLPDQTIVARTDRWVVEVRRREHPQWDAPPIAPSPPPERRDVELARSLVEHAGARETLDQIVALTEATARLIENDLSSPLQGATGSFARGDCTAHARYFVRLARAIGIPARLMTGYRLVDHRFVRHRWAIAKNRRRWITVDPTYAEAPVRGTSIGLVAHGDAAAEIALVDAMVFRGFENTRGRALAPN